MIKQLFKPELGWKRYDDTNKEFLYSNHFIRVNSNGYYNNTIMKAVTSELNNGPSIIFYAMTDKIRIISDVYDYSNRANNMAFYVDDTEYRINVHSGILLKNAVIFEKLNMDMNIHKFELKLDNKAFKHLGYRDLMLTFDAIDISDKGELLSPSLCAVKVDNVYYSFNKNLYDTSASTYNKITIDDIKSNTNNCLALPGELFNEVTINNETFRPIDKFIGENITLVSNSEFGVNVQYNIKNKIVTSKTIATKDMKKYKLMVTKSNNIKLLLSVDNGNLLYFNNEWNDSGISKNDVELELGSIIEIFEQKGMNSNIFNNANFDLLKSLGNNITIYVLLKDNTSYINSIDCIIENQPEIVLKDEDIKITKLDNMVEISPKRDIDALSVNIISSSEGSSTGGSVEDEELTDQEVNSFLDDIFIK